MRSPAIGERVSLLAAAAILAAAFSWDLPRGVPAPRVPPDNIPSVARVELGRHLFYDTRLSANGTQACASCHKQERAFTDGRVTALGSTGVVHRRNVQTLTNVAFNASFTWSRTDVHSLEEQALVPMLGLHPVEMGLRGNEREALRRIAAEPRYEKLFRAAFPDTSRRITLPNVVRAIASFERTLISGRSPYDRLVFDDDAKALSPTAWQGMKLFFSDRLRCSQCHASFNFSGPVVYAGSPAVKVRMEESVTGVAEPMRVPTLRNVALTAPYMHDGSIATLPEVIARYDSVRKLALTSDERAALVAFLESLTDEEFVRDERFGNPWVSGQ